jgi:hypothetical protein
MADVKETASVPQSQEIAVRKSSDPTAIVELERILLGAANPLDEVEIIDDPEAISRAIVAELLAAETDEELESFGAATGWRDLAVPRAEALRGGGVLMQIHGFAWRPSTFEESQGKIFFVISATRLDDGSAVTLTTGSSNVLAQLVNMAKRETLVGAVRVLVTADKATARGFYPLWLVSPPEKVLQPASE